MMTDVPSLSLIIVAVALACLLLATLSKQKHRQALGRLTTNTYFLMDQKVSGVFLTATYCASLLSAFTFVGIPGFFYTHGIGTWLFIVMADVGAVLGFYVFGRVLRRLYQTYKSYSPFEIIGKHYGSRALSVTAFVVTVVFVVPHLAVQIAGIGRLAEGLGINYGVATAVSLAVLLIYTLAAGMWGDVWTDVIQGIVMFGGLWIVAIVLLGNWDYNPSMMFQAVRDSGKETLLSLPGPYGFYSYPMLISILIMFISLPIVHAPFAMRFLLPKGQKELKQATIHVPWVLVLFFLPTLVIGIGGAVLYAGLESGDQLIGTVLLNLFGKGSTCGAALLGLILTAMVFAALSTVDSQLLTLGATFSRDIYRSLWHQKAPDRNEIKVARVTMLLITVLSFIVARRPPQLIIQLSLLSAAGTLQLLPAFVGIAAKKHRPSPQSALASIMVGLLVFAAAQWLFNPQILHGFHPGIVGLLAGTITIFVVEFVYRYSVRTQAKRTTVQ